MNIGVLCPSEIAIRRFMPALMKTRFSFVGLAVNSPEERYGKKLPSKDIISNMLHAENEKAKNFVNNYGGKIFNSYEDIINSSEIEALYIPLPPGLHFKWAKKAIEAGKHVLIEKPSTTCCSDTQQLISLARKHNVALHENYMFCYHSQLDAIDEIITSGELGEVRLYSIKFGFPMRAANDFRYVRNLGGGALLDAGGYCIKYATRLLGETARIVCSCMNDKIGYDVDIYGSGTLVNNKGVTAQIAFGMDNDYRCELEVWGSTATLRTGRVLTAPVGFEPVITISKNSVVEQRKLESDDAFVKSIVRFEECILNDDIRKNDYLEIEKQAILVDDFMNGER